MKATICKPNFWRMWCSCSISDIDTLLIWLLNYMSFEDRLEQDLKLINLIRFYYCFRLLLTYWISLWNSVDILQTMFVMNTEQSLIITNIFCIFEHKIDCNRAWLGRAILADGPKKWGRPSDFGPYFEVKIFNWK